MLNAHLKQSDYTWRRKRRRKRRMRSSSSIGPKYYTIIINFFALITIYQISTQFHARNPDCQITLQQEAMTKKETIIDFPESTWQQTKESHTFVMIPLTFVISNNFSFSLYTSSSGINLWMETKPFPVTSPLWDSLLTTKPQDSCSVSYVPRSSWPYWQMGLWSFSFT